MNITDVGHLTSDGDSGEDKMAVAAKRENKGVLEIAKYYTDIFFQEMAIKICPFKIATLISWWYCITCTFRSTIAK